MTSRPTWDHVIVVSGSRHWEDAEARRTIREAFAGYPHGPYTLLLHGDCQGIDRTALAYAKTVAWAHAAMPFIDGIGKRGGPVRNAMLLDMAAALFEAGYAGNLILHAFHSAWSERGGTADMVRQAQMRGFPYRLHGGTRDGERS
jgi:hypothetical protein